MADGLNNCFVTNFVFADHPDIPKRMGKLYNIDKFDASFFGIHNKQAQYMDPQCRILLEKTYEAVVDGG
jgi:fatty acid synthase